MMAIGHGNNVRDVPLHAYLRMADVEILIIDGSMYNNQTAPLIMN
jgi:hypothetical protein